MPLTATLKSNIEWNIVQISLQINHANSVNGKAKSGYYRVSILLAAAVAEALAHTLLKDKLDGGMIPPDEGWECFETHDLPDSHQPTTHRLSVCKRRKLPFQLTNKTDFVKVNKISKDLGIFSNAFFVKMDKVRILRNKIHLQSLTIVDRSYNKDQLDSIGYVIGKLLNKIT
ncbi:MAG TPA: hypothetical protein VKC89_00775 [Patescibacteria group bacterium]|nr:hypothetical protein [Patescibacteria group bacterium]